MSYVIGSDATEWALDELERAAPDAGLGAAMFVQRMMVEGPGGGAQEALPVWFTEVTLRAGSNARIHCEPVGVGEPVESMVRTAVRKGVSKLLRAAADVTPQGVPLSLAVYGLPNQQLIPQVTSM